MVMVSARKRKLPVTSSTTRPTTASVSSSHTRAVIRRYHTLLKQHASLSKSAVGTSASAEDVERKRREVEEEMRKLGGLDAYQHMSVIGQSQQRGGGSEKVLVGWLRELGYGKGKSRERLKLLEVGALKPDNYAASADWIDCEPIDLRAQSPGIREQDFLKMDVGENEGKWDVVSLSLVLNFVALPLDRGRMLSLAHTFLRPSPTPSYLFLVLPLPCVLNSRFLTPAHLTQLMRAIGFELEQERWKEGGKVGYWLWRRVEKPPPGRRKAEDDWGRKRVIREGPKRNNFTVLWDGW